MLEEKDQLLHMIGGQLPSHVVKRMSNRMTDSGVRQIFPELKNIPSDLLDLDVLRLGQVPEEQVDVHLIIRKPGRNLLADENIRKLGDLETSVDPVVIGEGNVCHPLLFQPLIQLPRIRIAIGKLEAAKNPFCGSITKFRVNVEVDFCGHRIAEYSGYLISRTSQGVSGQGGAHLRFVKLFAGLLLFFMEERAACCGR